MSAAASIPNPAEQPQSTRRDFLVLSAVAFASVGAAAGIWPMLHSLDPSADTRAEATAEVDLTHIKPGQAITVRWQGKPVFIVHRTEAQIARAEADDKAATIDPAKDRTRVKRREWLVVVGVCTHLGCAPTSRAVGDLAPRYGGWVCPCHYSQYDISGRVRRGPAPSNLPVPPYQFQDEDRLIIG
jgi:ubiquinol-cytochrome c reductase iron-sulfur subunit